MKGPSTSSMSSGGGGRSASDKEKTKMRERQRRSITTKIFHGLRKHGGYNLPPRADINDVLRELAREAGWVIEADGTTYRAAAATTSPPTFCHQQQYFVGERRSGTPTPTSSFSGVGGECSATASPVHVAASQQPPSHHHYQHFDQYHQHHSQVSPPCSETDVHRHLGMYFGLPFQGGGSRFCGGVAVNSSSAAAASTGMVMIPLQQQQQLQVQEMEGEAEEVRPSNQNTPSALSPLLCD